MACPICQKRKPSRFCPAKGEKICAVCCGTEREVSIDCPSQCPYLVAARRYERQHPRPIPPGDVPYPEIGISADLVHERRPVLSGLGYTVLKFARDNPSLVDDDVLTAIAALADTCRTLGSGIYYEKPPDALLPRALYTSLAEFLQQARQYDAEHTGFPTLKDTDVFSLLVFLLRVGRHQTNGRPRSRAFLDFLRAQYPAAPEIERAAPRIITP